MQYAEALREVKKAETEVRDLKADAQRQASQLLRDAEREANAALEKARQDAENTYTTAQDAARKNAEKERDKRIAEGDKAAADIRARTQAPDFKQAVDVLLSNFEKHISRK